FNRKMHKLYYNYNYYLHGYNIRLQYLNDLKSCRNQYVRYPPYFYEWQRRRNNAYSSVRYWKKNCEKYLNDIMVFAENNCVRPSPYFPDAEKYLLDWWFIHFGDSYTRLKSGLLG